MMENHRNGTRGHTLVLGGTGKTGRRVAERLVARGMPVRLGSRSGTPPFDWEEPATWDAAVEGMASVYVAYQPDIAFPGGAERVQSFVEAAVRRGVGRLVLLSGRNEPEAEVAERAVQTSGAEWTIVRSSFFAQDFSEAFFLDPVLEGVVAFPAGDTAEPFVDVDDIADVAAEALTGDRHVGQLYEVTGPRLLTWADAVAEISAATGRQIAYVSVSGEEFAAGMADAGVPPDDVAAYTDLFTMILDGRSEYVSDGVQRALGRQPRDFRAFVRSAAATGVWDVPARERA